MTATPLLDWTPRYPDVPGAKVPGPSEEAAEKVSKRVAYLQGKCLEALRTHGPLTADEIAEKVGETILSIRPRCSELKRAGKIQKTDARRLNISGCSATVWRIPC
jgi:predicted HTH transcriptional regulator